ncbi:MAG: hypothetical protein ACTSU5_19725 [Promethearchaeota archaeon]
MEGSGEVAPPSPEREGRGSGNGGTVGGDGGSAGGGGTGRGVRGGGKLGKLRDLQHALTYLIVPPLAMLAFAVVSFYGNLTTATGRYHYTGNDSMSMLGLLDVAHYRPVASEELWSWQFFFGNFQFLVIFSLIMAGFFLLFSPRRTSLEGKVVPVRSTKIHLRVGLAALVGACTIVLFEFVASLAPGTETGWGPHYFTGAYHRDIPELLCRGFYVTNNLPAFPQTFLSFVPLLSGLGFVFYLHGLKSFRDRGLVLDDFSLGRRPVGYSWLAVGLAYLNILVWTCTYSPYQFNAEMVVVVSMTAYTAFTAVMWILAAMFTTGVILSIQRLTIPHTRAPGPRREHHRKKTGFLLLGTLGAFIISFVSWLLPFAGTLGLLEANVTMPGGFLIPTLLSCGDLGLVVYWYRRERADKFVRAVFLSFLLGMLGFLSLSLYLILRKNVGSFEIAWIYNWVLPLAFVTCLTTFLYVVGRALGDKVGGVEA